MKANLKQDIILLISEYGDIDIGTIPMALKKVGLERLRFDGREIIDLAELTQIWVEKQGGGFILHAIQVPNSQLVSMTYSQRRYLMDDAGIIRLKTKAEIDQEYTDNAMALARQQLKRRLKSQDEINHHLLELILALIIYSRTGNAKIEAFFDRITNVIKDIYPLDRIQSDLEEFLGDLKSAMTDYWSEIDNITSIGG